MTSAEYKKGIFFIEQSPDEVAEDIKLKILELPDFKKQELKSLAEKGRIEDVVGRLNSEIELTPHEKKHFNNVPSEVVAKWFENKNGEDEDNKNNKK